MRLFTTLVVAATALGANALNLVERRDGIAPRVLQQNIQRRRVDNPVQRDRQRMRKRTSDTVSVALDNEETLYFMNVTIGTPAQSLRLHIDTGSSDLWTNVATSTLCEESDDPCEESGYYYPNKSTTYKYINSDFNITYEDGSGSSGDYVSDVVAFGTATLDAQEFGVGYDSSTAEGIIGIGYPINEVAAAYTGHTYANVPQHLMQAGIIATNAYSLWLNDLDASEGSILFGGVNTDKYTGTLETLPIITEDGVYAEFIIALTAVGANGTSGSIATDLNTPALLDSGTSLMYLPDDVVSTIYDSLGAEYDEEEGAAFIDCSMADSDITFDFTFSSPTISVAMSELVIVAGTDDGEDVCILGIGPAEGTTPVLGDTFLRSAYVVYDLTLNEISIAQTDFNSTSDNILEITNSTIPSATAVADPVTVVSVATATAGISEGTTIVESSGFGMPTAAVGYNAALLGAAGAAFALVL